MEPKKDKLKVIKIILLVFAYIVMAGLLFVFSDRIEAFFGAATLIDPIAELLQDLRLPSPRDLAVLALVLVISGLVIAVVWRVIGGGRRRSVIEVRLKVTENSNTYDIYSNDLKYYGLSLLPGFRSGHTVNRLISFIYFLLSLLPLLEGNYLITVVFICVPFIVFGFQGIFSRERRKVDFKLKILILFCFISVFGISSYSISKEINLGTFRSNAIIKVLCSLPDVLEKLSIRVDGTWFYDAAATIDKGTMLPNYKKAMFFEEAGDMEGARRNYEAVIMMDPANHEARYRLSKVFTQMGEVDKALEQLNQIQKDKPDFAPAIYDVARLLADSDRFDESEKAIDQYLVIEPGKAEAFHLKAQLLIAKGNLTGALEFYQKAVSADQSNAAVYKEKAGVLLKLDRLNEALYDIEIALKLNPRVQDAYLIKGITLAGLNDYSGAAESFDQALNISPDYSLASACHALISLKTGIKNSALKEIEAAVTKGSNDPAILSVYAQILMETGNYAKALQEIDIAISLDKSQTEFYTLKSEILLRKGDINGVEQLIRMVSAQDAEDDYLNYVKGRYYLYTDNATGALQAFDQAIKRNPYLTRAYAGKAVALSMMNQLESAEDSLYFALDMDADDYYSHYAKAAVYYVQKRYQSAQASLDKALAAGGQDAALLSLKSKIESIPE